MKTSRNSRSRVFRFTLDADIYKLLEAAAAATGIGAEEFIRQACSEYDPHGEPIWHSLMRLETGLVPPRTPLDWRQILIDESGCSWRILRVNQRTVRAQRWDDGPVKTITRAEAMRMRRAGLPRWLSLGDLLVWGDKVCRVTRLPKDGVPNEIGVTADWGDDDHPFEVAVPFRTADFHSRFMRFPRLSERRAFERAEKVREGLRFPGRTERLTGPKRGARTSPSARVRMHLLELGVPAA